jgi:trigger factor
MEVEVEKVDACRRKLKITVPVERVGKEIENGYQRLASTAKIAGFRPGRAPRKILELHFGKKVADDVKSRLVSETFYEAIKMKDVKAAIFPRIDVETMTLNPNEPFKYEIEVDVWPVIRVSGYKGIKAVRKRPEVRDKDVDDYIDALRHQEAEFTPLEGRPLKMGDFALLDISATVEGESIDQRKGVLLEMAEGSYLPGFCEKILGMEPGKDRSFTISLPADFGEEKLRGKEVSFSVILGEMKERKLPVLDEAFCKRFGDYKDVEELRRAVRENLEKTALAQARRGVLEQIKDYLINHNKVPLPQSRVDLDTHEIAERTTLRLISSGWKESDVLREKENILAGARTQAERDLRLSCICGEIAKREGISVTSEEVGAEIQRLAERLKKDSRQVSMSLEKNGKLEELKDAMRNDKVFEFLVKSAKIKEAKA